MKKINERNGNRNTSIARMNKCRTQPHDNQHDKNLGNLKTAEDSAAVGDGTNGAGKSQKADCGQDVAVDELPRGS